MSIGTVIQQLFDGPGAAVTAQSVQAPTVGQPIPPNAGATAPETTGTAANGAIPPEGGAPLDKYTQLWETDPNVTKPNPSDATVFGEVKGEDLLAAANGIDFTKAITPDILEKIKAGGDAGVQATLEAINKVTQLNYAQSAHTTTKLIEQAISKARDQFTASLPEHIRAQSTDALIRENSALSHPAAAPLVNGLVQQLRTKYPNASPAELTKQAEDYFLEFSRTLTSNQPTATTTNKKDSMDWEAFFN